MSHSKRNTSRADFTSYERSQLKDRWGTQASRLTRESFLPFASCNLCLQPARDPVACARGDIFCRECALSNLLSQRKEIKRLEKEEEQRQKDLDDDELKRAEEERDRWTRDFEKTQMGFDLRTSRGNESDAREENAPRGSKRKFEIDEDEMSKAALDERAKARRDIDREQAAKPTLPSFWVPSLTPDSGAGPARRVKSTPVCPGSSSKSPHPISLGGLVTVSFSLKGDAKANSAASDKEQSTRICPACSKPFAAATKAMLAVPCGHVVCKPCADKFIYPSQNGSNAKDVETARCYVCEASLVELPPDNEGTAGKSGSDKAKKKSKSKDGLKPGLVLMKGGGTGFAGAGTSKVEKEGVAFQC